MKQFHFRVENTPQDGELKVQTIGYQLESFCAESIFPGDERSLILAQQAFQGDQFFHFCSR